MASPALSVRGASKTFGGRRVLDSVDLELRAGEVHGLVGQNGSGKSTLIKILAGYHAPDPGCRLELRGREVHLPLSPSDPPKLGIACVHQDLGLVDAGSVLENLFIAGFRTRFPGRIDWRGERIRARNALGRLGLDLPADGLVGSLSPTERAMLAIARAVDQLESFDQGILILDEPTAYLPQDGVDRLFGVIKDAAAGGVAVLFVGHDLDEIAEITDRVTVLRDGRLVACRPTVDVSQSELVELILGFRLEDLYPDGHHPSSEVVLWVDDVASSRLDGVSLEARKGEILGLTGLLGSGYEAVLYAIFGVESATGRLSITGKELELASVTPPAAIRLGMALVPANRLLFGGASPATATENVTLVTLRRFSDSLGRLQHGAERRRVETVLGEFDVRPAEPSQLFAAFSGGNQQKLILAKWLELEPVVLLMHEPTQGVDVGARRQILTRLREVADAGAAVVVASAEYEELAQICDRVLIFRRGRLTAELAGSDVNHERILERCFAVDEAALAGGSR